MFKRISHKLKTVNPWHFLWIGILLSEILGLLFNTVQSYLWWGFLSRDLLLIGAIDCFFIPLIAAPVIIFFVRQTAKLEELNKELQLEVIGVKKSEEKKLRESEARYRAIVQDQTEFINRFQPDGTVTFVNESCCRYFEKKYDEFVGSNFMPLLPAEDREKLKTLLLSLTQENPAATIEHRVIMPGGEMRWQRWTNRAIFNENGDIEEFQAVGRDITDRKQSEHALAESEQLYRDLFENAPVGLGIADENGNLIAFNDAMLEPGGYTREDIEKIKNVSELYYDREERNRVLAIARAQGFLHRHPVQFKRKNGTPYEALLSLRFVTYKGSPCLQAMVEDITERQKIENALRESEDRLRKLSDNIPNGLVYQIDTGEDGGQRQFTYISAGVERLHGITVTEVLKDAMSIYGQIIAEDRIRLDEEEALAIANMVPFRSEARLQLPSGEIRWRLFTSAPRRLLNNHLIWDGIEVDITERKQLENSLRESENRFRIALLNSPIVVFSQDRNLRFTWMYNPLHGYSQDEVIGKTDADFFEINSIARLVEIKRDVIENGIKRREEISMEMAGKVFYFDSIFEPLYDPDGNIIGLTGVAIDITKRKQDEELIQSYQEQLSLMASRLSLIEEKERRKIALELHDNIGQILALAWMKLGEIRKTNERGFREAVEEIRSLLEKSIRYTRSLTFELSTPMLYEIGLESAVKWLGEEFQKKHGISFSLIGYGKDWILSEEMRVILFQCVQELMTNVVKHAHARNVRVSMEKKDHSMQLSVEDDGAGFAAGSSVLSDMKCGIGLFSVRERLKNIGGHIDIKSEPGSGTRVTLIMPLETSKEQ